MKQLNLLKSCLFMMLVMFASNVWGAALGTGYTKITDITSLSAGDAVVLYCDNSSSGVTGYSGSDATVSTTTSDWIQFVVEKNGSNYYLKNPADNKYVTAQTSNKFTISATSASGNEVTVNNNGVLCINSRYLVKNGNYYRMYSSVGSYQGVFVYKVTGGSTEPDPQPTTYKVSINEKIVGGTISANPTSGTAGTEVTLTATPATGYEFGSWNVTNASTSAAITVTDNKFTMPAANVNVSATFNAKAARPANEIFYESFDTNDGIGGNDDQWSGSIASNTIKQDNEGWSYEKGNGASKCAKFGTGSALGSATTPALGQACNATLTFKAAAWNGNSESTTLKLSVVGGGSISPATVTMTKGAWTTFTATLTNLTADSKIKFEGNAASNSRFFLDEISVVKTGEATVVVEQIPNFIKKDYIELEVNGASYDITGCLNLPTDYPASAYNITTSIEGVPVEDGVYAFAYPNITFQKAGTYVVTVTAAPVEGKYLETKGNITVKVTDPNVALTTMDEIFAAATTAGTTATDVHITFNNWVVTGLNGTKNAYITDNNCKGLIIYDNEGTHGFETGDIISGTVACKIQLFNGSAELTSLKSTTSGLTVTKGGSVAEKTIAIADLSGINTGALVAYEALTYHLNGTSAEFSDGENVIVAYKGIMNALPELVEGKTYDVKGIFLMYGTKKEILPRSAEDIVLKEVINNYKVTFDTTENGTIVVKDGETTLADGAEVAEGTVLTIECTPVNADYRFKNWQYKAGDAAWASRTTDFTYTMPSANVQFRANFELIPTYTVAWSVDGKTVKSETLKEGAAVTAPEVTTINGKVFTGWVETKTVDADATPVYVTPATADVTYYAVFATASEGGESHTNEITYDTENIPASYGDAADVTLNGMKFNITQMYKNGEKMQWRAADNKAGTGAMYNKTAIDGIQSIAITYTNDDTNKNFTVKVGDAENPTSGTDITAAQDGETNTYVYDCSSIAPSYFVLTNGSGAGYLSSIVITYGGGVSYSDFTTTPSNIPEEIGYETVDFPTIEPYKSINTGTYATVNGYDGHSFDMECIPVNDASTSKVIYIKSEENIKVIGGTKMTITADAPVKYIDFAWKEGYSDEKVTIEGLNTTTVTVTFKAIGRFTGFTVGYKDKTPDEPVADGGTLNFVATDGTDYYATFSSDRVVGFEDVLVGDDDESMASVKAYAVFVVDNALVLTDLYDTHNNGTYTYIPKNTGVLLKYHIEEGSTMSLTVPFKYADEWDGYLEDISSNNMLRPASATMETDGSYKFYKMTYSNAGTNLGFYWGAENGGAFTMTNPNGAYLAVPTETANKVKGFSFSGNGGISTSIDSISTLDETAPIYNVAGQRVKASAKGILIQNGKKYIRK